MFRKFLLWAFWLIEHHLFESLSSFRPGSFFAFHHRLKFLFFFSFGLFCFCLYHDWSHHFRRRLLNNNRLNFFNLLLSFFILCFSLGLFSYLRDLRYLFHFLGLRCFNFFLFDDLRLYCGLIFFNWLNYFICLLSWLIWDVLSRRAGSLHRGFVVFHKHIFLKSRLALEGLALAHDFKVIVLLIAQLSRLVLFRELRITAKVGLPFKISMCWHL